MNKYLIYIGILLALLGAGKLWHDKASGRALEEARNAVKQDYTHTYVEGLKSSLEASNKLLEDSSKANERLQDEKANDLRKRDIAIAGLQQRATRAEAAALRSDNNTASCPTALSAAELPREDAEFLIREASRADLIIKERDYYYERYERARSALEAYKRSIDRQYGASSNAEPVP